MDAQLNTRYHVHGQESPDDAGERSAMKVACCVRRGEVGKVSAMTTRQPPTLHCYSVEMRKAIERHGRYEAHVIPIILRETYWIDAPFSKLQVLPLYAKPIVSWHSRDEAFFNVVKGIRKVVDKLRLGPPRVTIIRSPTGTEDQAREGTSPRTLSSRDSESLWEKPANQV